MPNDLVLLLKAIALFVDLVRWSIGEITLIEHLCLALVDCKFLHGSKTTQSNPFYQQTAQNNDEDQQYFGISVVNFFNVGYNFDNH